MKTAVDNYSSVPGVTNRGKAQRKNKPQQEIPLWNKPKYKILTEIHNKFIFYCLWVKFKPKPDPTSNYIYFLIIVDAFHFTACSTKL